MEYIDTGVSKQAIGMPTENERKQLIKDGYTLMSKGKKADTREEYEIWLK